MREQAAARVFALCRLQVNNARLTAEGGGGKAPGPGPALVLNRGREVGQSCPSPLVFILAQ